MHHWLLLHFELPAEPSARRVYIWRKLKRLGAILLQDARVLPDTPQTLEQFQWVVAEILEMGGEATLWRAQIAPPGQDDLLIQQFNAQVDGLYQQILAGVQQEEPDLPALSLLYQQARMKDYFRSSKGEQVKNALLTARGESGL